MSRKTEILNIILGNNAYMMTCKKLSFNYYDDVFQEVCEQVLTIPEHRLPSNSHLPFWFYCVAKNTISKLGKLGKIVHKEVVIDFQVIPDIIIDECIEVDELDYNESKLLDLSEFENRIALLYAKLGNMRKVQKETGISYSALRQVKEKIKKIR